MPEMKAAVALALLLTAAVAMAAPLTQKQCRVVKDVEYREVFETKCKTTYK